MLKFVQLHLCNALFLLYFSMSDIVKTVNNWNVYTYWWTVKRFLTTQPSSPAAGDVYYDTTDSVLKIYNWTDWDEMSWGGGGWTKYWNIDVLVVWWWWGWWWTSPANGVAWGSWWWWGWWGVKYCPWFLISNECSSYSIIIGKWWSWTFCQSWQNWCMSCFWTITVCWWWWWWRAWYWPLNGNCWGSWWWWWSNASGWSGVSWQWYNWWTWSAVLIWWWWWWAWWPWAACMAWIWCHVSISWTDTYYWSWWWAWWYCWCCWWWNWAMINSAWASWCAATWYWWWWWGGYGCVTNTGAQSTWWAWKQWIVILRYKTDWSCWIRNLSYWWTKYTCWEYTIHCFTDTSATNYFCPVFK